MADHKGFSSATMGVDAAMSVPRIFGRLLLLKLLARGGMGDVYLAATTGIEGAERGCVVKTVRRDHIHDGSFLARFLDEARVQSQLNHPGVAQVLEASTDENGEPYTVVEHVEGRSLADVRQRSIQLGARIGWPEAVAVSLEMAQALAHVHDRSGADGTPLGIVHRDLSPQNVMVGYAGEIKLIDFGTARGHNRRCHTVAGVVFAKPGYVAPEVARQQVGDGRIDLYALGIMLWELCAGKRFLTGDAQQHLEDAAAGKVVVPKLAKELKAPALLDEVIHKLTANEPDDRYTSASLAAADMAKVLTEAPAPANGERGVRGRIQTLMRTLWPQEPGRSRAEFAKLLKEARALKKETVTPAAGKVAEIVREHMNDDASVLSGTPYRLVNKIGEGASGIVYEAEHVELGRRLALKVLAPEHGSAKDAIDRFRREARVLAALSHPNLCVLYDFGKALDGRIFLAMELLAGETLDRRLKGTGGMDWREAVGFAVETTRALEAAHAAGLVHRDLKPANLFVLKDGGLKLLDFGVAMALSDNAQEERRQKGFAIFGTPEYMAPEQVAGETVDGRCDVYALGCVLYELTTGHPPFEGASSVVVMGKQLREVPEPPRTRAPERGIPEALEAIILTALAKKPDNRFETAEAMRLALEELLVVRPTVRPKRVRFAATTALLGFAAFAAVGFGARYGHELPFGRLAGPPLAAVQVGQTQTQSAEVTIPTVPVDTLPQATLAAMDPPAAMAVDLNDPEGADAPSEPSKAADPHASTEPVADRVVARRTPAEAPSPRTDPTVRQIHRLDEHGDDETPPRASPRLVRVLADKGDKPTFEQGKGEASVPRLETASLKGAPSAGLRGSSELKNDKSDSDKADRKLAEARDDAKAHPGEARALKQWAVEALRAGEKREARRAAEAWMRSDKSAEPRVFLANVLDRSGHQRDARALLEEVLRLHPDSKEARRLHAQLGPELPPLDSAGQKGSLAHR